MLKSILMAHKAVVEEAYQVVARIYQDHQKVICQPLPGSSHYGKCPDQCELYFNEFGLHARNLLSENALSENASHRSQSQNLISSGSCYKIKELKPGQTINSLTPVELKQHYRTICNYCEHEFWTNTMKVKDRAAFDSIIYMDIDRPQDMTNYCHALTPRLQMCKNRPVYGKYFCSSHQNQKVSGLNA